MFLKSYTELSVAFDEVRAALSTSPESWLDGVADAVERQGSRLLVDVGLEIRGHEIGRTAWLEIGEPVATSRVISLPLSLRVRERAGLFPPLDGSLDAAWLGHGRTQLALTAQYDPPFGVLGRTVDRALLHRVAEAVARHFLESVAERLVARSAARRTDVQLNAQSS
jgi:hypothetical protein